ncbi:MAG: hypothetical protein ACREQ5_14120, partial [Candidatus Dormibacteria bacterium]
PYPIVTGEPFSAEYNTRTVEIRNGKRIVHESHSFVARDSAGHVATRTPESPHVRDENGVLFVIASGTISDPAAGVLLYWDEEDEPPPLKHVVFKRRIRPNKPLHGPQALSACERVGGHPRDYQNGDTEKIEDLGERTIQNIPARGCRVSVFVPAGSIHNDQLLILSSTYESWISPQLRITLIDVDHDPRVSDSAEQLDNIATGEPDPSLFQPPPGYKIRDLDAEREDEERSQVTLEPEEPDAETMAGAWETGDPFASEPSQIGILVNIHAYRHVPFLQGKVVGSGTQKITSLNVRVYRRVAGAYKCWWFAQPNHGGASWHGNRLRIEFDCDVTGNFMQGQLGLDLAFNQKELTWTGSYARNDVTRPVVLARPGASLKAASNPFLGGWSANGGVGDSGSRCVYIAQRLDGSLLAWDDAWDAVFINPSGGMTNASFQEDVGDPLGVRIDGNTVILEEGIYWGGVAGRGPRIFTGKLSPDESQIVGSWDWSQHTTAKVTTFTKMAGQSCRSHGPK